MDDMLLNKDDLSGNDLSFALDLGKLLDDHNGGDVMVMDMRSLNFWTDFFVIATATSNTHLMGLERHIKNFTRERGLEILHRSRKPKSDAELRSDEWCLLDLGNIVVHLMSAKVRSFFELERLWSAAPLIYQTDSLQTIRSTSKGQDGAATAHSSKSS